MDSYPESAPWFRRRSYLHFDQPVSLQHVLEYFSDKSNICKHSFWPFLHFVASTKRYKPDQNKNIKKQRSLCYAAHIDSHIYAKYSFDLREKHNAQLADLGLATTVLAYRRVDSKSNIDFAFEAFCEVANRSPCRVLTFDISAFFDSLDHVKLKSAWCELLGVSKLPSDHYSVFRSLTRHATVNREEVLAEFDIPTLRHQGNQSLRRICSPEDFRRRVRGKGLIRVNDSRVGIPQGSSASATLSNIYMTGFDSSLKKIVDSFGGFYRRYSDDILIICNANYSNAIVSELQLQLSKVELKVNEEKSEMVDFVKRSSGTGLASYSKPLQYLGFLFDGTDVFIRPQTLARYHRRLKSSVHFAKMAARQNPNLQKGQSLFRKQLYEDHTHLGKRNFISYARRCSSKMNSNTIRKQISKHWTHLEKSIKQAEESL